jgi:hypothetical protein
MVVAMILLGIWALVTIPMALVLLLDNDTRRPAHPPAPVITLGDRRGDGPHHHRPAA